MKAKSIIFILLLTTISVFAQQDSQFTSYMYNTININSAYAGNREVLSVFGLHRTQWVGMEGAPVTNAFSLNTPIENTNLGVGLSFINDKIGASDENTISADVSYGIQTGENYRLSFGLKASANILNVDYTKLSIYDNSDTKFQNIDSNFSPNLGAGVYFNSDKMYLGFSVPNLFNSRHFDDNISTTVNQKLHYYFIGGYVFDLGPNVKFKPAFLSKAVQGAPLQLDVSGNFLFNEKFTLGAAWRWNAAASVLAGFQVTKGLLIGYSYDMDTSQLVHYNSGSHEIFLRFDFLGKQDKILSPRFF
ncbi:MAG: type IX secretion system membrane protein PorP/SprF [Flavobacterium sp.]